MLLVALLGAVLLSSCRLTGVGRRDQADAVGRSAEARARPAASHAPQSLPVGTAEAARANEMGPVVPSPPGADRPQPPAVGGAIFPAAPGPTPPSADPAGQTFPTGPPRPAFPRDGALAERLAVVVQDAVSRGITRRVGVAVYDLAREESAGLNAQHTFRPASVIKLAVLVAAFQARPQMAPGQFDKLRPDLERMIIRSDNPATRRLVKRLGARQVNAAIGALGLERFRVGQTGSVQWVLTGSKASPADTAILLARIARREVVSAQASEEMLALLGAQQRRGRIPAGVPAAPDLWVGNKTGTLNGVVNDAGVVLQPERGIGYTLAIFTSGTRSEAAGERLLADLSAVVYGYMSRRSRG